jgi:hypothetical protein
VIRSYIFAIAAALSFAAPTQAAGTLDDAEDLYFQAKIGDAEQGFRQVLASVEASPSDKAGAARGLARIAWHIDADGPGALKDLDKARATGVDLCAAARDQVRILREMGQAADAAAYANARGADCSAGSQADGLHIQSAMAELEVAARSQGMPRSFALQRAKTTLDALSPERRFSGEAQRAHLELALLESDSKSALDAWRGYYWLTDRDSPAGMAVPKPGVAAIFHAALGAKPTLESQISLLRLLLRGGFYQEAQRYDAAARVGVRSAAMPSYAPVAAYYQYRRELDPTLLDFNRSTARGRGDPEAFTAKVQSLIVALAQANRAGIADPAPVLKQVYGMYWALGNTGGFASLHQGHIVVDGRIPVVQFNRKRELGFISLDNMTANGFQTWLWDGSAETGGWTTDDGVIVQVRSAYTPPVLNGLLSLSPDVQARNAKKLEERAAVDTETLKTKQIAYLPALTQRLDQESIDEIAAAAHATAQRLGKPFALTFVKLYWDAMIQHSIIIHEGRHALDKAQYGEKGLSDPELEYRAKLSELELSDYPRMGMSNMMAPNLGDGTPHGDANERIYSGLVEWMSKHKSAVAGFDASVPPLEQVDKMTDEQLRGAARELDPQLLSN